MKLRELVEDLRHALTRLSRSFAFRRRGAAVVAVLVAYLVLKLAAPEAPCGLPGGECPQGDDAISLVPAGSYAYAHAGISPDAAQFEQGRELLERLPNFPAIAQGLFRELGPGRQLDLGADVFPWLGDEVALAVVPGSGGEPQGLLLVAVDDEEDARQLAARVGGGLRGEERYRGVAVEARAGGEASAVLGGFLALGPEDAIHDTIDVSMGRAPSLDEDPRAEEMRDELPGERLAEGYVSAAGMDRLLAGGGSVDWLDAFVDFDAGEGVAAALVAGEEGLQMEVRSRRDPAAIRRDPGLFTPRPRFDRSLAAEFPAETLALLAIGDHTGEVRTAIAEAIPPGFYNAYKGPGDRLVVSTSRRGDARRIDDEGDLAGAEPYRLAVPDSPAGHSALVFLDLSGLVRLAATRGLAEIVSGFQADLAKLRALGVTVDADEDSLETRLFLEIE